MADRAVTTLPRSRLDLSAVTALRNAANRFGAGDGTRAFALLTEASSNRLGDAEVLLAYHDVLLFMLAYPETARIRSLADRELSRIAAVARDIDANGPASARRALRGSGIAWSTITIAFGYALVHWLVSRFPSSADVDSFGERGTLLVEWLRHGLPAAEFDVLAYGDDSPDALLEAASKGWRGSRLAWLVSQFERLPCDRALRESLYDSLELFVSLNPRDAPISRTFARGLHRPAFYLRSALARDVDVDRLAATPLTQPLRLGRNDLQRLVDTGRGVLAMLGRETDPITYAEVARTRAYALGRGVDIALYSAEPSKRSALDSHIGYMLFKNGVPVGYGGGWPFLGTCRIGINIFAPFRGGESAFLMASVLRAYARLFAAERFLVEPYQFGAGNREGLESGAFWFYFRLGFRPVEPKARALAEREFARMQRSADHRTPLSLLRRFARFDLERPMIKRPLPACDPSALSQAVTNWIASRFQARRDRAEAAALRTVTAALGLPNPLRWDDDEHAALRAIAPVLAQIGDLHAWRVRDKRRLAAMIRAKGGDEYRYFALMADFPTLREALNAIARTATA